MFPFLQPSPNATEKRVPEHKGTSKNINFDKIYETSIVYCAIVTEARKSKELEIFLSILRGEKTEIGLLKRQGETRIWELLGE